MQRVNNAGNNTVESLVKDTVENSDSSALSTNLYVAIEALMGAMLKIIWKNIVCLNILRKQASRVLLLTRCVGFCCLETNEEQQELNYTLMPVGAVN